MNTNKRHTLNRTTTKWFVVLVVLSIISMALWTAFTVRDLSTDLETQELLDQWRTSAK